MTAPHAPRRRPRRALALAATAALALPLAVTAGGGLPATAQACPSTAFVGSAAELKLPSVDVPTHVRSATDIPVPANALTNGLAITPDGTTVFLAMPGLNQVMAVDTTTRQIVAFVPAGNAPQQVAITPDGTTGLVVNAGTDDVTVFDVATRTPSGNIALDDGTNPSAIAISPDGTTAYTANLGNDTVSTIDVATLTPDPVDIPVGLDPSYVAFTPDGTTAIVPNRAGLLPDDPDFGSSVSFIDTATRTVTASVTGMVHPAGAVVSDDGATAYVTSFGDNVVYQLDVATRTLRPQTLPVGNHPFDIAITPDGSEVWVSNLDDVTVSVIDVASGAVTDTVGVAGAPTGIAFTPCGSTPPTTTTTTTAPATTSTTATTTPATKAAAVVVATPTFAG